MKATLFSAAVLATVGVPAVAAAAVTVIGNSAARGCYEAAAATAPRQSLDLCNRALTEEALTRYEMVATHVNRGIIQMKSGAIGSAIADFDRAITIDPNQAEAYLNKGVALSKLSAPDGWSRALPMFSLAIEKNTKKPALAYFSRGVAHEMTGDDRAAYYDYKRASALDPEWGRPAQELTRFSVVRR